MDYVDFYRRMYESEDPWHFGTSPFEAVRHAAMIEFALSLSPRRVLDLGCGEGHFLGRLLARPGSIEAIGVELDERAARRCRDRLAGFEAQIVTSDLLDYLAHPPGRPEQLCDVAVCGDVLYHLAPEVVRQRVVPALPGFLTRKGGLVISYADVNDHAWTVEVFKSHFALKHSVYIRPLVQPPPWPWVVALMTLEGCP